MAMVRPIITFLCLTLAACSPEKKTQDAPVSSATVSAPEPSTQAQTQPPTETHYDCACMLVPVEACDNACCDPNSATLLEEDCKCVVE